MASRVLTLPAASLVSLRESQNLIPPLVDPAGVGGAGTDPAENLWEPPQLSRSQPCSSNLVQTDEGSALAGGGGGVENRLGPGTPTPEIQKGCKEGTPWKLL